MLEMRTRSGAELKDLLAEMGSRVVEIEHVLRRIDKPGDVWEEYEPTGEVIVRVGD